ncbi:MAG TPA: hypothetical protein VF434_02160 [Promineifilum sp.]
MDNSRAGGSILQPILTLLAAILLIAYVVGALNTGNWVWFLPIQPKFEPTRILVRDQGQSIEYRDGVTGFIELKRALDLALADFSNSDLVPLGLSDETLLEYNQSAVVVEVYYPEDIRFNTAVRMRNVNKLLIPIEGRHAGNRYIFLGTDGSWLTGAMVMADDAPLHEALRQLGHIH